MRDISNWCRVYKTFSFGLKKLQGWRRCSERRQWTAYTNLCSSHPLHGDTVTPEAYMYLGVNSEGKAVPGFLGIAANVSALCTVTDGLRTGEVTCRVVFPKLAKDIRSTPRVENVVFVCRKFGANTIYAFLKRFPNLHPAVLFFEMITDNSSYTLFLTAMTKPGRRRFS